MIALHTISKVLEDAVHKNDDPSSIVSSLNDEFTRVVDSIQTILKGNGTYVPASDAERVIPSLLQLEKLLTANDPDAAPFIVKLGTIGGYERQIEELRKIVINYDFDRGLVLLRRLKSQIEGRFEHSS